MEKIRNEYIRGTAQVGKFGEKTREARLRWYGHLRGKDDGYIGRRMLRMELPGKRKRGRLKRMFMGVVKEDMAEVEVTEEDTIDRNNWRGKSAVATPDGKSRKKKKKKCVPIALQGFVDVGHILHSTIKAGNHDFCSPHECMFHRSLCWR